MERLFGGGGGGGGFLGFSLFVPRIPWVLFKTSCTFGGAGAFVIFFFKFIYLVAISVLYAPSLEVRNITLFDIRLAKEKMFTNVFDVLFTHTVLIMRYYYYLSFAEFQRYERVVQQRHPQLFHSNALLPKVIAIMS